ncbi:MAG: helix-turn-helix domain-containing protein [Myxococcota bacterium]|nr:helix-turn-helix domain-containing protein [Myxococcota bacterium]
MAGQLTIRLPDAVIEQLNHMATTQKITRATLIRRCLDIGLREMSTDTADVTEVIQQSRDEILAAVERLRTTFVEQTSSQTVQQRASAQPGRTAQTGQAQMLKTPAKASSQSRAKHPANVVEVVGDNDEAHRRATLVTSRTVTENSSNDRTNFYLDDAGQVHEDRRKVMVDANRGPEQRIGLRLRRLREAKGWSIDTMASALKISTDLMIEIELGRRGIPGSRAIRAEAKLQQWEAAIATTSSAEAYHDERLADD